jgi:hypothetical protein
MVVFCIAICYNLPKAEAYLFHVLAVKIIKK